MNRTPSSSFIVSMPQSSAKSPSDYHFKQDYYDHHTRALSLSYPGMNGDVYPGHHLRQLEKVGKNVHVGINKFFFVRGR